MKLLNFYVNGKTHVGVLWNGAVADLSASDPERGLTTESLIAMGQAGLDWAASAVERAPVVPLEEIRYAPIVQNPEKIFCIGLNYQEHATQEKKALPVVPEVFSKFNNALAAHQQPLVIPAAAGQVDYEAELVAVIGREGRNIPERDAMEYVYGYTCGNDLSARREQSRVTQWLIGKSGDCFAPIGPWIVTKDELNAENLEISLFCNGERRQHDTTANMIFKIPHLISYLSQYITLRPGDLIFTGTCAGCITSITDAEGNHPWLKPGDELAVEIEGIGRLCNWIQGTF